MDDTHDYRYWNTLSEKEYLKKAHESIENSQSYSLEEAEMMLDEALTDMSEYIGLAELISERKTTSKESYIPFEDVMAKAGITL